MDLSPYLGAVSTVVVGLIVVLALSRALRGLLGPLQAIVQHITTTSPSELATVERIEVLERRMEEVHEASLRYLKTRGVLAIPSAEAAQG